MSETGLGAKLKRALSERRKKQCRDNHGKHCEESHYENLNQYHRGRPKPKQQQQGHRKDRAPSPPRRQSESESEPTRPMKRGNATRRKGHESDVSWDTDWESAVSVDKTKPGNKHSDFDVPETAGGPHTPKTKKKPTGVQKFFKNLFKVKEDKPKNKHR